MNPGRQTFLKEGTGNGVGELTTEGLSVGQNQVSLELRNLVKRYGSVAAVDDVSLVTKPGEFITLLGPSGSGKTTTLNLIAGFLTPDSGDIYVDGGPISSVPPHRRNIGMVFQNYMLFPHMTAEANIAFPLKRRKLPAADIGRKVGEALDLVGLRDLGTRYPRELSGGQQQRVALARAIVYNPPILLMDEPLGALDKNLRESLQIEIRRIHRELGTTFLYVTHDQGEALALSDRIAIFKDGKIEQVGTTTEVYDSPTTTFVATFIGESNIIRGQADSKRSALVAGPWTLALPAGTTSTGHLAILVRPEKLSLGGVALGRNSLRGVVIESVYLGSARRISMDVRGVGRLVAYEPAGSSLGADAGSEVEVSWAIDDAVVLAERSHPGSSDEDGDDDAVNESDETEQLPDQQSPGSNSLKTMEDQ